MSKLVSPPRPAPWGWLPPGRLRVLGLNDIIINGVQTIDQKDLTGFGNLLPEFQLNDLNESVGLAWLNLAQNITKSNAITHFVPKDRQWWLVRMKKFVIGAPPNANITALDIDGEPMNFAIPIGMATEVNLFGDDHSNQDVPTNLSYTNALPVTSSFRYKVVVQSENVPNPTDGVWLQMIIWEALNQTLQVAAPPPIPQEQLSKENNAQWQV